MLVSGCVTAGVSTSSCTGSATRLTEQEIAALSDAAIKNILATNELGAAQGCYKPNK